MIDTRTMDLVRSDDPEDVKRGIKMLARSGDPEALDILREVYRRHEDEEIRDLTIKAGRFLKKNLPAGGPAPFTTEGKEDQPAGPIVHVPVPVSEAAERRAAMYIERAIDFDVKHDKEKAQDALRKALKANPNLVEDATFMALAHDLTGMVTHTQAIDELRGGRGGRASAAGPDASNFDVFLDLLVYFVVVSALFILQAIVIAPLFNEIFSTMFDQVATEAAASGEPIPLELTEFANIEVPIGPTVIGGLLNGFFATVSLLVQAALVHFVATRMLGGAGYYRALLHRTTLFLTIITALTTGLALFSFWRLSSSFGQLGEFMLDDTFAPAPPADIFLWSFLIFIISLGGLYWYIRLVAKNYGFGWFKGCGSLIIGGLILTVIAFCASTILFTVFGAAMSSVFPGVLLPL
jgi:hypothetical protein